ncbi:lysE type translocator family protein [Acinetobacter baumannii 144107]|uniref:LysE family translocator n=1 Tax=Acinetobacter baumannii TaxID=470 RepID=UPI000452B300|nr:LysE family translocator [Acinetobacter baumannii]EIB6895774.1 LysE family translocator [Acinetobacter baumannii]EKV0480998.1 LysE family translocator [Acinetobacter baumannii]EKW6894569.1 LysE family translocator [Acinetobacter baumannii]EKW9731480.1 LysE family translocator [Acinetobacter baumannii]ELB2463627.1 LysE family translocator [Acinetobacter baumannii]
MWQLYGHEFLTLALIHFMAVILPGPDFVITVRQSVRYGYLIGCLTAIGIGVGISVHVFYTLVGIGFLIQQSEWFMSLIRTAGAAYLVYLGWQCLRSQPNTTIEINGQAGSDTPSLFKAFTMGFLTNALNPKATIFFLAIFTTIVSTTTPMKVQVFYGIWMCMVNAIWFMVVSVLFAQLIVRKRFLEFGVYFERVMGVLLIGIALRLIWGLFD